MSKKIIFDQNRYQLYFLAVVAIALFLRLWHLDRLPCGLFPDQASNGLEALRGVLPFYDLYSLREGLFNSMLSIWLRLTGFGRWQLLALSSLIGWVTVPVVMVVVRRFHGEAVSLFAGLLLATSPWHLALSRSGFRVVLIPLLVTLLYWSVSEWLAKPASLVRSIALGLLFGLGFYTYLAYRAVLMIIAGVAGYCLIFQRSVLFQKKPRFLILSLVVLATLTPLVVYAGIYPEKYSGRSQEVSVLANNPPHQAMQKIGTNFWLSIKGFFLEGDPSWISNFAKEPFVQPGFSVFLGVGLLILFLSLSRIWPGKRFSALVTRRQAALYFLSFLIFTLPSIFTDWGQQPHGLRLAAEIPLVFLITALGLIWLINFLSLKRFIPVIFLISAIRLGGYAVGQLDRAEQDRFYAAAYRCDLADIAEFLKNDGGVRSKVSSGLKVYVVGSLFDRYSLDFALLGDPVFSPWRRVWELVKTNRPVLSRLGHFDQGNVERIALNRQEIVILPIHADNFFGYEARQSQPKPGRSLQILTDKYPNLTLIKKSDSPKSWYYPESVSFWVYELR